MSSDNSNAMYSLALAHEKHPKALERFVDHLIHQERFRMRSNDKALELAERFVRAYERRVEMEENLQVFGVHRPRGC